HLIRNEEAFREAVGHAARLAVAGHLVTFGVVPDAAETGFGYIELGDRLDEQGAAKVRRFVEKPDEETARRYVE
ncbi:sugar phosphate nucleotidyltransferase, partial [Stenotrophomonas maltophilia]